jgi:hypothetical protein
VTIVWGNFKVGCYTGTIDKYTSIIPGLSIDLFVQVDNAEELEKKVRDLYGDQLGWYHNIRLILFYIMR